MASALFGLTGEKNKGKTGQGVSSADFFLPGPQASTAWFGSAGGQTQGKTGQGVSAADFVYRPGGGTQDPFSSVALFGAPGHQSKKDANAHGARGSRNGLAGTQDPSSSAALFGPPGRQYEKEANAHGARGLRKGLAAARARVDTTSDKEAHFEANRPALMKGADRKAAAERKKSPERGRPIVRGRLAVDDSSDEESNGETITDRDLAAL